ncbi:unnamed protein product [Amoebophrya sp. A25]|nr:unnamed protein product [Amoebophrya sp. A25]|eukprot:GSA25T00014143001.1
MLLSGCKSFRRLSFSSSCESDSITMGRSRDRGRRGTGRFRFDSPPKDSNGNPIFNTPAASLSQQAGGAGADGVPSALALTAASASIFNVWNVRPDPIVTNFPQLQNVVSASREAQLAVDCQMSLAELYFANLPPGISIAQLRHFVDTAARTLGIGPKTAAKTLPSSTKEKDESRSRSRDREKQEQPKTGVVEAIALAGNGRNFAWVTFQKDRWAMLCLQLHGLFLCGRKIRVGRTYAQVRDGVEERQILQRESERLAQPLTVAEMQRVSVQLQQQQQQGQELQQAAVSGGLLAQPLGILGDEKLCLHNIPTQVPEEKITQLLKTFGHLKYFQTIQVDGEETKAAFFQFEDFLTQKSAPSTLKGLTLGGRDLKVITPEDAFKLGLGKGKISVGDRVIPTRILYISNFMTDEELRSDEDYDEICGDIKVECECYGRVLEMVVPRPQTDAEAEKDPDLQYEMNRQRGVGWGFIEFEDVVAASKAKRDFDGRKFGEFRMGANFLNERQWRTRDFRNIQPNTEAQDVIDDEEEEMDMSS